MGANGRVAEEGGKDLFWGSGTLRPHTYPDPSGWVLTSTKPRRVERTSFGVAGLYPHIPTRTPAGGCQYSRLHTRLASVWCAEKAGAQLAVCRLVKPIVQQAAVQSEILQQVAGPVARVLLL